MIAPHPDPHAPAPAIDPVDAVHHLEKIRELRKAVTEARTVKAEARAVLGNARMAQSKAEAEYDAYVLGLETALPLFDPPAPEPTLIPDVDPPARKSRKRS